MKLSVLIPGIRPTLWRKVYDSLAKSCTQHDWEIVFVGPYEVPEELKGVNNIQYIASWASPIVCRQMALLAAKGEWICYAADDVEFVEGALDRSFSILSQRNWDPNTVVVGKYIEGVTEANPDDSLMRGEAYWTLKYHAGLHSIMRPSMWEYYLINTGLVSRQKMLELGGWDCQFEACAMACVDLSLRLQIHGVDCILQDIPIFKSTHLPMHAGDHGPIHDGQTLHDEPLFFKIWGQAGAINRTQVDIDLYKRCPTRWERRFGVEV